MIQKTTFPTFKVEINKPDLRRIYLNIVPDLQKARMYIDVLGNWRCDYEFVTGVEMVRSQHMFRSRVAEKQHTEMFLMANLIW